MSNLSVSLMKAEVWYLYKYSEEEGKDQYEVLGLPLGINPYTRISSDVPILETFYNEEEALYVMELKCVVRDWAKKLQQTNKRNTE